MSVDFHKVLVKDGRIGNLTSDIAYAVNKGGQQITSAQFLTNSTGSTTSQVFNIQVPSHETIIDRSVLWQATVTLKITGTVAAGTAGRQQIIRYGITDMLSAFPLHQLCTTMTATINNNNVNINIRDVLPSILRMVDDKELTVYGDTTPTAYDKHLNYDQVVENTSNSPFSGYEWISDNKLHPRGTFALDSVSSDAAGATPLVVVPDAGGGPVAVEAYVKFTVREPLLLSPHIFGNPSNNSGIYGIQNLNYQFNLGNCDRVWRRRVGDNNIIQNFAVSLQSIEKSSLNFTFITPHPSDLLPSRCVSPYYELPRYISAQPQVLAGQLGAFTGGPLRPTDATFTFSSISMNQIPDKLIIFARKSMGTQSYLDADSFLPIDNISINWNNNSGLLSSHTSRDLYNISKSAGSNQSYDEWRGFAYTKNDDIAAAGSGAGKFVLTSGSMLMIDIAKDLSLTQDYYAPGSIGNFVLNFTVRCKNYGPEIPSVELVCMTMNSGVFVCERGTSSTYTAILSKQDVLEASEQQGIPNTNVHRMVGSGFLDNLKSTFSHLFSGAKQFAPLIKTGLQLYGKTGDKYSDIANTGANVLGSLGYGRSAGSSSGGALGASSSGGSLKHRLR